MQIRSLQEVRKAHAIMKIESSCADIRKLGMFNNIRVRMGLPRVTEITSSGMDELYLTLIELGVHGYEKRI